MPKFVMIDMKRIIMIISGAIAYIDTLHVDWHLRISWQVLP